MLMVLFSPHLLCSFVTIIASLNSEFAMKDLDSLSYFLGISVARNSFDLFLFQKKYAQEIIDHVHMSNCKPSSTPINVKPKLSAKSKNQYHDHIKY